MASVQQSPIFRRNRILKRGKGSQTPGKQKGETCKTSPRKKFFMTSPKAFRHPQYAQWHALAKRMNTGAKT